MGGRSWFHVADIFMKRENWLALKPQQLETETGGLWVWGQTGIYHQILSTKKSLNLESEARGKTEWSHSGKISIRRPQKIKLLVPSLQRCERKELNYAFNITGLCVWSWQVTVLANHHSVSWSLSSPHRVMVQASSQGRENMISAIYTCFYKFPGVS